MTTIKKELTHEALIKADTETKAEPVVEKKINTNTNAKKDKHSNQANMKEAAQGLGQLGALLGQMSKAVGEENSKDMQGAGAFLKALGGLVDPKKTEAIKKEIAQEKQIQQEENKKADKAFDEMSQELEMFTN
jgi:ribosomal protein L29